MADALKLKAVKQPTQTESFRVALKDVIEFSTKLKDVCQGDIDELISICELAQTSDAQAKILMDLIGQEAQ